MKRSKISCSCAGCTGPRLAEDEKLDAETRERDKLNAKRAYKESYPESTDAEFEQSYASLLQQQAEQAVVRQQRQLRAHAAKRISRGI